MLVFVSLELISDAFEGDTPLLLQQVVLLETSTHMPLILLVVLGDLRFALLEDFNFEATLARPLLSQILVQLLHRLVLHFFDLGLHLVSVVNLLCQQPTHAFHKAFLDNLEQGCVLDDQVRVHGVVAKWILRWLHLRLLHVVIHEELDRFFLLLLLVLSFLLIR